MKNDNLFYSPSALGFCFQLKAYGPTLRHVMTPCKIVPQPARRICIKCQVTHIHIESQERICSGCQEAQCA